MTGKSALPSSVGALPNKGAKAAPGPAGEAAGLVIVGIGASAGGLDAARTLLDALPPQLTQVMTFVLVQHLDPTHKSMMVELLASHTTLIVRDAGDGMPLAANHLYVIPPGKYLAVADGALHLSLPVVPHGARMPIDFLLQSIAREFGAKAIGIILSGTGSDGSLGAKAIRAAGGLERVVN